MVGLLVEVPVQAGIYIEGRVVSYDEFLGVITVIDSDGELWKGAEFQAIILAS